MHRLTHFRLCPLSRSVRLALTERDIPFGLDEQRAWEGRAEFLALNPAGDLPVMTLQSGEVLCGTYAIIEYISEEQDNSAAARGSIDLLPGDGLERAETRRLIDWFHRKFYWEVTHELLTDKIYPLVTTAHRPQSPDPARLRAARRNLRYHLSYISYLADQRSWLSGDGATYADLAAAAHLSVVDYVGEMDWDAYPIAKDWYVRIKSRPSFRAFLHERIAGPPPPSHYAELDF